MTYLFFVQGEGRGHLTQALALQEKLRSHGHEVLATIVGINPKYELPLFFREQIGRLFTIDSPSFIVDKKNKRIKIFASTLRTIWRWPRYLASLKKIKEIINDLNPDALINFYEPLSSNYYRLYRDKRPLFCIGHQYFIKHPVFKFPKISLLARWTFKFYNYFSAPARAAKIALSFTAESDQPKKNLFVCPPLIRTTVKKQAPTSGDFILVYLLNAGYSEEIIAWSQNHPEIKIKAFWSRPEEETRFGKNLVFYRLSGEQFINCLTACRAYISTAGFDSIAEAAYLQKDILMIPTGNHFEQKCNAEDAGRAGIALASENFDLSPVTNKEKTRSDAALRAFKEWVDKYDDKIIKILEGGKRWR